MLSVKGLWKINWQKVHWKTLCSQKIQLHLLQCAQWTTCLNFPNNAITCAGCRRCFYVRRLEHWLTQGGWQNYTIY